MQQKHRTFCAPEQLIVNAFIVTYHPTHRPGKLTFFVTEIRVIHLVCLVETPIGLIVNPLSIRVVVRLLKINKNSVSPPLTSMTYQVHLIHKPLRFFLIGKKT